MNRYPDLNFGAAVSHLAVAARAGVTALALTFTMISTGCALVHFSKTYNPTFGLVEKGCAPYRPDNGICAKVLVEDAEITILPGLRDSWGLFVLVLLPIPYWLPSGHEFVVEIVVAQRASASSKLSEEIRTIPEQRFIVITGDGARHRPIRVTEMPPESAPYMRPLVGVLHLKAEYDLDPDEIESFEFVIQRPSSGGLQVQDIGPILFHRGAYTRYAGI